MEEKNEVDRNNDVMLPGFRFHPTDEELVSFYLKRKVQQRPLPIELIKQVDIYKYDPWDLPKLAMTGEREWYFYCPRDRKYRNSARPNRVTGAGFWKATGTDRPIHSSDGTKCIGLKKSLVFYRGRAAKGMKTDWMMHEFRLPSLGEPSPPKKFLDRSFPANDAWAICRIFKKSHSMAQRALSYSWVSNLTDPTPPDMLNQPGHFTPFSSENISYPTETGSFHTCSSFPALDMPSNVDTPNFLFSPVGLSGSTESSVSPSTILNPAMVDASKPSDSEQQFSGFSISFPHTNICSLEVDPMLRKNQSEIDETSKWESAVRSLEFPFSLPPNFPDAWKTHLSSLDSPPCPSEMSTTYSLHKCYT
ncbi:hypothetical protein K2173_019982 [Erythroxylum novogranatense]|uniref:NAC domain-containing protein n=1 Tax=Erythroxylum novogranatense TaxID=1862640 RepID=A0AAV8UAZ4_9ROSI|nr:hypothetical protein K2173_019982 [Erythroxylum novogranatense]